MYFKQLFFKRLKEWYNNTYQYLWYVFNYIRFLTNQYLLVSRIEPVTLRDIDIHNVVVGCRLRIDDKAIGINNSDQLLGYKITTIAKDDKIVKYTPGHTVIVAVSLDTMYYNGPDIIFEYVDGLPNVAYMEYLISRDCCAVKFRIIEVIPKNIPKIIIRI